MTNCRLPAFSSHIMNDWDKNINPHLLYFRYLKAIKSDSKNNNSDILKQFCSKADTSMIKIIRERQNAAIDQIRGYQTICKASFSLVDRLVIGMGIPSSFETGMLLDWIHGIPFINGDAIKGATRAYGWEHIQKTNNTNEKDMFKSIFGTMNKEEEKSSDVWAGKVIFFNAYPKKDDGLFEVDIITNHYGPYYTGSPPEPPGDWHNPNPVPFIAIKAGTSFEFALSSENDALANQAMEWLKEALCKRGIGAKKHVGYGHFNLCKKECTNSHTSSN